MDHLLIRMMVALVFIAEEFTYVQCKEIIVSKKNGNDSLSCGETNSPCKSLEYAILTRTLNNDSILLDGGNTASSFEYKIKQSIVLKSSFIIKKFNVSRNKPIISKEQYIYQNNIPQTTDPMFRFAYDTKYNLMIKGILIYNLNVEFGGNGNLTITNCVINNITIYNPPKKNNLIVLLSFFSSVIKSHTGFVCIESNIGGLINTNELVHLLVHHSQLQIDGTTCNFIPNNNKNVYVTAVKSLKVDLKNSSFTGLHLTINNHITYVLHNRKQLNSSQTYSYSSGYYLTFKAYDYCKFLDSDFSFGNANAVLFKRSVIKNIHDVPDGVIYFAGDIFNITHCQIICSSYRAIEVYANKGTIVNFTGNIYYNVGFNADEINTLVINQCQMKGFLQLSCRSQNTYITNSGFSANGFSSTSVGKIMHFPNAGKIDIYNVAIKVETAISGLLLHIRGTITISGNYSFLCPANNEVITYLTYSVLSSTGSLESITSSCEPCKRKLYTFQRGIEYSVDENKLFQPKFSCNKCPVGAICQNGIRASDNYWGYLYNSGLVYMTVCPPGYCCTKYSRKCLSYNTCNRNRKGTLCGSCDAGFFENILSTECVSNDHCTSSNMYLYWFVYCSFTILLVLVLLFTNRISKYLNTVGKVKESVRPNDDENLQELLIPACEVEHSETDYSCKAAGLLKLLFFFYQIETLLRINTTQKDNLKFSNRWIREIISSVFNLKLLVENNRIILCPARDLTRVKKEIINVSFIFSMLCFLLLLYIVNHFFSRSALRKHCCKFLKRKNSNSQPNTENVTSEEPVNFVYSKKELTMKRRIKGCCVQILLFGYVNIAVFLFRCISCIQINSKKYLYIQGNIECYNKWQILAFILLLLWVIPFCLVLFVSTRMLQSNKITSNQFILTLLFPPAALYYGVHYRYFSTIISVKSSDVSKDFVEAVQDDSTDITNPSSEHSDVKYLLSLMNESFRSTKDSNKPVLWECMFVFRRLILALVYSFVIHPLAKLYLMLLFLTLFLLDNIRVKPYKDNTLNWLEIISLAILCFMASINTFWASAFSYSSTDIPNFAIIGEVLLFLELFVLVFPFIVLFIFLLSVIGKQCVKTYKELLSKQD